MVAVLITPALPEQGREGMHPIRHAETAPKAAHFLRSHAQGCRGSGSAEFNLENFRLSQVTKAEKE